MNKVVVPTSSVNFVQTFDVTCLDPVNSYSSFSDFEDLESQRVGNLMHCGGFSYTLALISTGSIATFEVDQANKSFKIWCDNLSVVGNNV